MLRLRWKWGAVRLGALTTSIYHTRNSLVRAPNPYFGRLWVRILFSLSHARWGFSYLSFIHRAANWPAFIYRISQKPTSNSPTSSLRLHLIISLCFLLTSASLSRCTPAKSNASLRKPCLSVRSMDAITARHSCHTLFQFPCLSGSEGVELPWDWEPDLDWGAFDINSKFELMCYYLISHSRIAQFSGDIKMFSLHSSLITP